jgi:AcrR family transcriptional regulator
MLTTVKFRFMALPQRHPTRELLIDVALGLFAADGYRGTTTRKIEEAAGLTPGAGGMYRHFRSKEDLLLAAVERYRADVASFVDGAPELMQLGDVRAELLLAAKLSREFNERNDALLRVLILEQQAIPQKARRHFQEAWEDAYRLYAQWLAGRLGPHSGVDIEAAAIQLFGSLAQYQVQVETFTHPPLAVEPDRFIVAWADHWAAFIAAARAGDGGENAAGERRRQRRTSSISRPTRRT